MKMPINVQPPTPAELISILAEFRSIIADNKLNCRTDDEFLERFLRLRRYQPQKAFNKLKKYESFKAKDDNAFLQVNMAHFKNAFESNIMEFIDKKEDDGTRVFWLRLGLWNPSEITPDELLQFTGLLLEIYLAMNKSETVYTKIIFDLNDFGMKHVQAISAKFAKKLIYFINECLPALVHSIAIVREPKLFSVIFNIFKPFLDENMKKHIKFMGQDFKTLHEYANPEVLPPELGGKFTCCNSRRWLTYIDLSSVKEDLQKSGFTFK